MIDFFNFIKNPESYDSSFFLYIGILSFILYIFSLFKDRHYLLALITLPGTFFHELSHLIVSLLTNGKPISFTIIPKIRNGYIILGEVKSANIRWYNAFFIGIAPLLLIIQSFYIYYMIVTNNYNYLTNIILIFLSANLLYSSIPSKQDLKVGMLSLYPLFFVIVIYLITKTIA